LWYFNQRMPNFFLFLMHPYCKIQVVFQYYSKKKFYTSIFYIQDKSSPNFKNHIHEQFQRVWKNRVKEKITTNAQTQIICKGCWTNNRLKYNKVEARFGGPCDLWSEVENIHTNKFLCRWSEVKRFSKPYDVSGATLDAYKTHINQ